MARATVQVTGIRELQAALRAADRDTPKMLRVAFNEAAKLVIDYARPRIPTRTGAARGSLKVRSSQRECRIAVGGRRAPYYPWLDFGGRVGPGNSVRRPFLTEGRYVYPGLRANREEITRVMGEALDDVVRQAGLDVT